MKTKIIYNSKIDSRSKYIKLFGKMIIEKRSKIKITTKHMASLLGVKEKFIIKLENTNDIKTISFETVIKFAEVFNIERFMLLKKLGWKENQDEFFKNFPR